MTRYLRLYGYFLRFSFSRAMEFRFDFFFRIGMDLLWYVVHLAFFEILYLHTPAFGGLDQDQMVVFLAALFMADALHMTIISNNLWWLPTLVNNGDLDYYLVRPVSSLFFMSLREFAANSFLNLLMTFGFMIYALARYPDPLGVGPVALFVTLILTGAVLSYTLNLLFTIPVFWTHAGSGLREVNFSLAQYANRPDKIYTGWVRRVLTTVLPFAVVVSYPVNALFAGSVGEALGIAAYVVGLTVVFFLLVLWLWNRGLRIYASASS